MERRISIAGSRDGYYPFFAKEATPTEISEARRIGPFTRDQIIAMVWRIKKFRIVAAMAATAEKEVYNEATEEFETETTPITREVDLICVSAYLLTESETEVGEIPDEKLVAHFLRPDLFQVYQYPATGGAGDENANFSFLYNLYDEVWKDPDGGHWVTAAPSASTLVGNSLSFRSTWDMRSSDDPPGVGNRLNFTGELILGGLTVDLPMVAYAQGDSEVGDVVSVDSASFTVTVEEWRPYATTTGAAAWNPTTGAPVNGGPGA